MRVPRNKKFSTAHSVEPPSPAARRARCAGLAVALGGRSNRSAPVMSTSSPFCDPHRAAVHFVGAASLGVIHQRVGAMDQLGGELARDAAALRHVARGAGRRHRRRRAPGGRASRRSSRVQSCDPTALLEAVGDLDRLGTAGQVGDQEAELVAAEARVQIARLAGAFEREEILRADLVRRGCARPAR